MHAVTRRSLWLSSKQPARVIAGRRYRPNPHLRSLTSSPQRSLALFPSWPAPPPNDTPGQDEGRSDAPTTAPTETPFPPEVAQSLQTQPAQPAPADKDRNGTVYGSGRRRATRNTRAKDIAPIRIPVEFVEHNVRRHLLDDSTNRSTLEITGKDAGDVAENAKEVLATGGDNGAADEPTPPSSETAEPSSQPNYELNQAVLSEVTASISAGLSTLRMDQHGTAEGNLAHQKSLLKLLCPIDGGIYFLDKVVEDVASRLGADVIKIDPQTIAEIAGDSIRETGQTSGALWTLGYDTAEVYHRVQQPVPMEEEAGEGGEEDVETDAAGSQTTPRFTSSIMAIPASSLRLPSGVAEKLANAVSQSFFGGRPMKVKADPPMHGETPTQWNDMKLGALLETIIASNLKKRDVATPDRVEASTDSKASEESPDTTPSSASSEERPKTVIVLKDFKELQATQQGSKVIHRLVDIIQKRRIDGHSIMLVGTSSSSELAQSKLQVVENLQSEDAETEFRTILVAPDTNRSLYFEEDRRRVREINGRHIYSMIKRLQRHTVDTSNPGSSYEFASDLHKAFKGTPRSTYLEDQALSFDDVHRIVFTALGQRGLQHNASDSEAPLNAKNIMGAIEMLEKSDKVKMDWATVEHQLETPDRPSIGQVTSEPRTSPFDLRIKRIRKTCNSHEKKLLHGVINPDKISTAFADVHAEPQTIDALKMLTTLSLRRPDAFKYGVLAKDKLNGVLLYGPPGTGKTLLAKAVAHESGATMLEVSGSDVYDMYVGEGEKNVRAVFSLAKKLAPCVVFIDEADAIFASRGSGTNRNSHRELINQFLREWDGMTETSAFIMVATNRPFDLDDAALRRLPRRLLVDLPNEKDREAILRIHLKDETLAADVDISKLANRTPLYSGSDLKNLAVAAALTAVREETEEAQRYESARAAQDSSSTEGTDNGEEKLLVPFKYPERRTLTSKHFEQAMEEISASVNEDMSSLGAIKKFDEKYGDRRGRRKKTSLGFSPPGGEEEKVESVKVRS